MRRLAPVVVAMGLPLLLMGCQSAHPPATSTADPIASPIASPIATAPATVAAAGSTAPVPADLGTSRLIEAVYLTVGLGERPAQAATHTTGLRAVREAAEVVAEGTRGLVRYEIDDGGLVTLALTDAEAEIFATTTLAADRTDRPDVDEMTRRESDAVSGELIWVKIVEALDAQGLSFADMADRQLIVSISLPHGQLRSGRWGLTRAEVIDVPRYTDRTALDAYGYNTSPMQEIRTILVYDELPHWRSVVPLFVHELGHAPTENRGDVGEGHVLFCDAMLSAQPRQTLPVALATAGCQIDGYGDPTTVMGRSDWATWAHPFNALQLLAMDGLGLQEHVWLDGGVGSQVVTLHTLDGDASMTKLVGWPYEGHLADLVLEGSYLSQVGMFLLIGEESADSAEAGTHTLQLFLSTIDQENRPSGNTHAVLLRDGAFLIGVPLDAVGEVVTDASGLTISVLDGDPETGSATVEIRPRGG